MKRLFNLMILLLFLFIAGNCFALTVQDLNGLFILKSVQQYDPQEGTMVGVTFNSGTTYGYGYFTLNNRFRIRIKYKGDGLDINRDEIGSFTLNGDTISMTIDKTGSSKDSTITFANNILNVETDFTDDPNKGYILTMELTKEDNILNQSALSFQKGWNLLSVSNFIKPIDDFNEISSNINTVWRWNVAGQKWEAWSPDTNIIDLINQYQMDVIKEVRAGEGFWLQAKNDGSLSIDNFFSFIPEMLFAYSTGWNLLGVVQNIAPGALPDSQNLKTVWKWDVAGQKWEAWSPDANIKNLINQYQLGVISVIKAKEGFWVNK